MTSLKIKQKEVWREMKLLLILQLVYHLLKNFKEYVDINMCSIKNLGTIGIEFGKEKVRRIWVIEQH